MKHNEQDKNIQSRHRDLPGQLDLAGAYVKPPDEACKKNAAPLTPPARGPLPKVKAKRRIFNLENGRFCGMPADTFVDLE